MASITEVAQQFFDACETGKGWQGCQQYRDPKATFRSEATPLAAMKTLEDTRTGCRGCSRRFPTAAT